VDAVTAGSALRLVRTAAQFTRLAPVGATVTLVAVGLAAGDDAAPPSTVVAVVAAALLLHIGVYVGNDIADVEIDRTDANRAHLPLAAGTVPMHWAATTVAASLLLGAVVLGVATADAEVLGWYALAVVGLLTYDVFGKRTPVPPVLDLAQGGGWASLVLVAAASAGGVGAAAGFLACSAGLYVALVNGVIASLRDLANDFRHGARTTAVLFMTARGPAPDRLPAAYQTYALVLHVLLGVSCVLGVASLPGGTGSRMSAAVALAAAGEFGCLVLLILGLRRYDGGWGGGLTGFAYVVLALWCLCTVVLARFGWVAFAVVGAVLLGPWLGSRVVRSLFRPAGRPGAIESG